RMLSQAKKEGIVEIKLNHFDGALFELEEQIKRTFDLTAVEIVPNDANASEAAKEEQLSAAAGAFLRRQFVDGMVV
ncbi:hypothetical protein L0M92_15170, partial [Casaltella massiliensis]|nr:hypothetical protein [Casaltella massiliensis]